MFSFDITVDGVDAVVADLARVAAAVADIGPPLKLAGKIIADSTAERFKTGGADVGGYKDILPQSRRRRKGNRSAPPLTDTEALMRAATSQHDGTQFSSGDTERTSIYRLKPDGLEMGAEAVDALRHQDGGPHEPARPFMVVTDTDEGEIDEGFETYYDSVIGD